MNNEAEDGPFFTKNRLEQERFMRLEWKREVCTIFESQNSRQVVEQELVSDKYKQQIERELIFFKWANPASFSFIFVFSNTPYNFYNKYMWKNVHPVYSVGIRTHDLWNVSLLP